ncbi:MAG: RMD1 family protein [Bacteroidetes bacterium]|nr:RMD1 family protein [Bacteroidota bacterium]
MILIIAYQIAENTNIKKFKSEYTGELINSNSFELFYKYKQGYVFVLNYGVVVFANVDDLQRSTFISLLTKYCVNHLENRLQEDFIIEKKGISQPDFSYNSLIVNEINDDVIRIAMLQVAQSLALDFYQEGAQHLFEDSVNLTNQLEMHGKLKISKRKLLKFIGKTLNTKNRIIDNLYIYDTPSVVWEDEFLGKVNAGLTKTFDISIRFKELEYMLKRVENNLSVFVELTNAEESKRLEWVVIILIFIEILHLFINDIFV